jgi:hypothetical protein
MFLNGRERATLSVRYADFDSDIDCSDDEGEQESVVNDTIQVESDIEN